MLQKFFQYLIAPAVVALIVLILQFFIQPIIQRKITSTNEEWLQKKEIFSESIVLAARRWDSSDFDGPGSERHILINNKPSSAEKNKVLAQLYMVTKDMNIPEKFVQVVDGTTTPEDIGEYVKMLRKELYGAEENLDPSKMKIFYNID